MTSTRSAISATLFQQWDPLGVKLFAPADEYDDYAAFLQPMIDSDASADAICSYLTEVRANLLLMAPDLDADRRVAELIRGIAAR